MTYNVDSAAEAVPVLAEQLASLDALTTEILEAHGRLIGERANLQQELADLKFCAAFAAEINRYTIREQQKTIAGLRDEIRRLKEGRT